MTFWLNLSAKEGQAVFPSSVYGAVDFVILNQGVWVLVVTLTARQAVASCGSRVFDLMNLMCYLAELHGDLP
jgi:hypothetical protein